MENSTVILAIFLVILLYVIFNDMGKSKKQGAGTSMKSVLPMPFKRAAVHAPTSDDYNEYIVNAGLEQSVIDSHRKFAEDMNQKTSGASAQTTFSHDEDPSGNGWRGLRRPDYSGIYMDPNAREVPSTYKEQMPKNRKYNKCGLF